ncbi:ESX secretion-associated protein EspG [Nocardia testacea]|uniref:ESX secretion-associated protein EspG n=1 Tax=Nocardia testacea TaxID=248551 RepID=UPI003C2BEDEE
MRSLTNDELLVVAEQLGIQTLPRVLGAGPQQDSYDSWRSARIRALEVLRDEGVVDSHNEVEPELAEVLSVLRRPEQELVARIYTADAVTRVSVARRAERHAVVTRIGDRYDLDTFWSDGSPATLTAPLLSALGQRAPAHIPGFSAPTSELAARLDAAQQTGDYIDALYALGIEAHEATILGAAFGSCHGRAEIVAYSYDEGTATRAPGAVAVYDTERGRIVAAPMVSPDRQVWSTVTTGSDHRIAQAVAALLEGLPEGRWHTP